MVEGEQRQGGDAVVAAVWLAGGDMGAAVWGRWRSGLWWEDCGAQTGGGTVVVAQWLRRRGGGAVPVVQWLAVGGL